MKICGSNVFGQWLLGDPLIHKFQIKENTETEDLGKLILIRWAYNIYLIENSYIISGNIHGIDYSSMKVKLPEIYHNSYCLESDLIISGNDYKIYLVDIRTKDLWIHNFTTSKTWDWTQIKLKLDVVTAVSELATESIKEFNNVRKIICSNTVTYILTTDGDLYEYPNKTDTSKCIGKLCDFDYGYEHGILLTDAGVVYTLGNGRRCQLGHGLLSNSEEPVEVSALSGIKIMQVRAGGWHCLALSEFGDVYTWGWNDTGQLGIRDSDHDIQEKNKTASLNSSPVPKLVDIFDESNKKLDINVLQIACGSRHSAILLEDYSVWTTGSNKYGQLAVGKDVDAVNNFKKVFTGNKNSCLMCGPWSTVIYDDI